MVDSDGEMHVVHFEITPKDSAVDEPVVNPTKGLLSSFENEAALDIMVPLLYKLILSYSRECHETPYCHINQKTRKPDSQRKEIDTQ